MAECAQRYSQRAKQTWIALNWYLIISLWNKHSQQHCDRVKSFSQSSMSRSLNGINYEELALKFTKNERDTFEFEWKKVREYRKLREQKMKHKNSNKDKRKQNKVSNGKFPHYSLDGKSRKGVLSEETGRTEIDLTLFNPDTDKILAQKTLPDKEGEAVAAEDLIKNASTSLPEGVFTADAGITSPRVVAAIQDNNHHYILAIKGNAGKIYEQIKRFNWDSITTAYAQISEGHGRREIRKLKKMSLSQLGSNEYKKYSGAKIAFKLDSKTNHIKDDKLVVEERYFIADEAIGELTLAQVLNYIRNHWIQESYHWVKDVILNEDNCPQKTPNGSRILSSIRAKVYELGKKICGSVKKFTNFFVSKPEIFLQKREKE